MNNMMVIAPYWHSESGAWVFDDLAHGLIQEPFVLGVSEMIDDLVGDDENAKDGFKLIFSASPFPTYTRVLTKAEDDMGGSWYHDEHGHRGWLCPALFHYFSEAPDNIYIKSEPLK